MRPAGHGETQPRLDDDRLPIVLLVLDGLGDRPIPELNGCTPAEAADTPNLDSLAASGSNGWHLPFGWGPAPASELAHWSMFGFHDVAFPGRAVLEGLGAGLDIPRHTTTMHASLRTSRREQDRLWISGRAGKPDEADAEALLAELQPLLAGLDVQLEPLGRGGEALLFAHEHASAAVTDSDPFFETFHPCLRPRPTHPDGQGLATTLNELLRTARDGLLNSDTNATRHKHGLPPLDILTTKWTGVRGDIPSFAEQVGVNGAAVTSTRLYQGLAAVLGMISVHLPPIHDLAEDLSARLDAADELIAGGARFVHVHTKATDEAGHTKNPHAKRDVLEAGDPSLARLGELTERSIVAVTGDHATPSTHGTLHTADPTPLTVAGPTVRQDEVREFGEWPARHGWYGRIRAEELLPLLAGHANRPAFLGHRITTRPVPALADSPEPLHFER